MTDAAWHKQPGMVWLLLEAGADPNGGPNYPPLQSAAFHGTVASVKHLLAHPKIEVDKRNRDGRTALITAAGRGHAEVVQMLLKAGADPTLKCNHGKTAADHARDGMRKFEGIIKRVGEKQDTAQDCADPADAVVVANVKAR